MEIGLLVFSACPRAFLASLTELGASVLVLRDYVCLCTFCLVSLAGVLAGDGVYAVVLVCYGCSSIIMSKKEKGQEAFDL